MSDDDSVKSYNSDDAEPFFVDHETVAATVDGDKRVATVKSIIHADNNNIVIQASVRYADDEGENFHTVAVVEPEPEPEPESEGGRYVLKTFETDRNPLLRHILATAKKTLAGTVMRLIEKTLPPGSSISVAEELSNDCKTWAKEEMVRLNRENQFCDTYGVQTIDKRKLEIIP